VQNPHELGGELVVASIDRRLDGRSHQLFGTRGSRRRSAPLMGQNVQAQLGAMPAPTAAEPGGAISCVTNGGCSGGAKCFASSCQ
jgi:hypothetical protein